MIASGISVRRLQSEEALEHAFANGLIGLYQNIFAEEPYQEKWEADLVERTFRDTFENGIAGAWERENGK